MRTLAVAAVIVAVCVGCAIPVRPIAKIETGKDGLPHFIPDPDQEPSVADAAPFISVALKALGPWGELAAGLVTLAGTAYTAHHVGRKRERKSLSKPPKIERPADAN